jgi:hypothetical protein
MITWLRATQMLACFRVRQRRQDTVKQLKVFANIENFARPRFILTDPSPLHYSSKFYVCFVTYSPRARCEVETRDFRQTQKRTSLLPPFSKSLAAFALERAAFPAIGTRANCLGFAMARSPTARAVPPCNARNYVCIKLRTVQDGHPLSLPRAHEYRQTACLPRPRSCRARAPSRSLRSPARSAARPAGSPAWLMTKDGDIATVTLDRARRGKGAVLRIRK